jgi:hypothetical protein
MMLPLPLCSLLDLFPPGYDFPIPAEVEVSWCDVVQSFVIALVVVISDEASNLLLQLPGKEILRQVSVLDTTV